MTLLHVAKLIWCVGLAGIQVVRVLRWVDPYLGGEITRRNQSKCDSPWLHFRLSDRASPFSCFADPLLAILSMSYIRRGGSGHIGGIPEPGCDSTRTERVGRIVRPCTPSAIPKVCWTGSSTSATIKPHPVYDTLKGAAVGTYLQVRTAAASAYLGVGVLQRSRPSKCRARAGHHLRHPHAGPPGITLGERSSRHIHRRACPCPPDRADRDRDHRTHEHRRNQTALSKPENSGS